MWRLLRIVVITLLALALSACSAKPDATDYFPLNKGMSWQYRYQITSPDRQNSGLYTVSNLGKTDVNGETTTIRRTNTGRDYYLTQEQDGIYRLASRTLFETRPAVDEPARLVLPLPYLADADRQWSATTNSYVIHRVGPSTVTTKPAEDFMMSYRIDAKNETVSVPAGTFKNCLLVVGEAKLTIFADPMSGFTEIPITTREWYAPGIGLVKLERAEPMNTSIYKGGTYLFELLKFTH